VKARQPGRGTKNGPIRTSRKGETRIKALDEKIEDSATD
jgi:hypothetical protein